MTTVVEVSDRHLDDVAAIHVTAFTDSAVTRFGPGAVRRYYRMHQQRGHLPTFLAVIEGDRMLGFVCGGRVGEPFRPFVMRHWPFLVWYVLTHPQIVFDRQVLARVPRLIGLIAGAFRRKEPADDTRSADHFVLLSIATDPAAQRSGVGSVLIDAFETSAERAGVDEVQLWVTPTNTTALSFYLNRGWSKAGGEPWDGEMRKTL